MLGLYNCINKIVISIRGRWIIVWIRAWPPLTELSCWRLHSFLADERMRSPASACSEGCRRRYPGNVANRGRESRTEGRVANRGEESCATSQFDVGDSTTKLRRETKRGDEWRHRITKDPFGLDVDNHAAWLEVGDLTMMTPMSSRNTDSRWRVWSCGIRRCPRSHNMDTVTYEDSSVKRWMLLWENLASIPRVWTRGGLLHGVGRCCQRPFCFVCMVIYFCILVHVLHTFIRVKFAISIRTTWCGDEVTKLLILWYT